MLDLSGSAAQVTGWSSPEFDGSQGNLPHGYAYQCSLTDPFYIRAAAWSPDDSTVYTAATGFNPWNWSPSKPRTGLCDSVAAFPATQAEVTHKWVNYTGCDSLYSVAADSSAVYIGGHERWADNTNGCNHQGSGALPAPGLGGFSPSNGALITNSSGTAGLYSRSRGRGADDLLVTGGRTVGCQRQLRRRHLMRRQVRLRRDLLPALLINQGSHPIPRTGGTIMLQGDHAHRRRKLGVRSALIAASRRGRPLPARGTGTGGRPARCRPRRSRARPPWWPPGPPPRRSARSRTAAGPCTRWARFTQISGCNGTSTQTFTRNNIFSFSDTAPFTVTSWEPDVNGTVNTIAFSSGNCTTAYIGGQFTSVGGTAAKNIAEIDTTTGALVARVQGQRAAARWRQSWR